MFILSPILQKTTKYSAVAQWSAHEVHYSFPLTGTGVSVLHTEFIPYTLEAKAELIVSIAANRS